MTDTRSGAERRPRQGRKGRRHRIARNIGLIVLALVLVAGAFLGWLLGTPAGLRFALERTETWLPGTVAIETAEGRLAGPLTLTGVRLRTDAARVRIERLRLDWSPLDLLRATLHVDSLAVNGVDVALQPGTAGEATGPPELPKLPDGLSLPLAVELDTVAIDDVALTTAAGAVQRIDRLRLTAVAAADSLRLQRLNVVTPEGHLSASLETSTTRPYALDGRLDWSWETADEALPPLAGHAVLDGTLADLHVVHELTAPTAATVDARLQLFGDVPRWQADLQLPATRPQQWLAAAPPLTASADLHLTGTFDRVTAAGSFELSDVPAGPIKGQVDLAADAARVQIRELVLEPAAPGDARARLSGDIALQDDAPRFDLALDWTGLRWPFEAPALVDAPQGRLAVTGTPADYRLQGRARLAPGPAADLPVEGTDPAQVTLSGTGSTTGLQNLRVQADWRETSVEANGHVRWEPAGEARLEIALSDVRPGHFAEAVSGRIDAGLTVEAAWAESAPRVEVALERLDGELNGHAVDGRAQVRYGPDGIVIPRLRLTAGDARLQASGRLAERVELEWSVEVPSLDTLVQSAAGQFSGSGRITGTRSAPVIEAEANGRQLRWQDITLARLVLEARATIEGRSDIALGLHELKVGETAIQRVGAALTGTVDDHRLAVEATGEPGRVNLVVTGGAADDAWRGTLERAVLAPSGRPEWELAAPAPLSWAEGRATLEQACWRQGDARACLSGGGTPDEWRARIDAEQIALALLGEFAPPELAWEGALSLQLELAGGADPVTGKARVDLTAGRITGPVDDERRTLLAWQPGDLEATLSAERVDARLQLPLADGGRLAATVGIGRGDPAELAGRIEARIDDLGLAAALTPEIGAVDGTLLADIALNGTLAQPRLSGSAELRDGRVAVVPLGIDVRALRLELETTGQGMAVDARARSGEGRLRARLQLKPGADGAWQGEGSIRGENFTAVSLPEATVTVSPQLEWRIEQRTVRVEGQVVIPSARLEPRDLSGAVQPSPDTVVVGADGQPPQEQEGWRVYADVGVVLGEQVYVSAFGLEGELEGDIRVQEQPGKLTSATGELRVAEDTGTYTVYRQTLEIVRGRVLFDGGPVGNPGLDVRAVRRPRDVVVGVNVRGTLRNPRVTLFSEPPMSESQQLSYLIAGMPLRETSGEQESAVTAAATALASSRQGEAIAERLGIDELGVEREEGAGASLVLGRYLSPRLYVGYGIGLADQANSVRLRYELTDEWSLEARSGNTAGADLLYSIETD